MTHDTTESVRPGESAGTEPPEAARPPRTDGTASSSTDETAPSSTDETASSSTDETASSSTDETASSSRTTRRDLLRTTGTTLALGGAVGSAGCLSALPPLGGGQRYGRIDAPAGDTPGYRRWLPAPDGDESTADGVAANYVFTHAAPGGLERAPHLLAFRYAGSVTRLDYFGVGYENYDLHVGTPYGTVLTGEFPAATVHDTLADTAYARTGTHREYTLYGRPDGRRRVAVRDGTVLFATPDDRSPDLERLADTGAGVHPRVTDQNEAAATAIETAGAGVRLVGGREFGAFHEAAQWGVDGFRIGSDGVYQVIVLVFESADSLGLDALRNAYQSGSDLGHAWTREATDFDARLDGRVGVVEARVPTSRLQSLESLVDPVQVTWGGAWDAASRRATLRHEAGETVESDRLAVHVDTEGHPGKYEPRTVWVDETTVGPGAETTVDLADTQRPTHVGLTLQWVADDWHWSLLHYPLGESDETTDGAVDGRRG